MLENLTFINNLCKKGGGGLLARKSFTLTPLFCLACKQKVHRGFLRKAVMNLK
ncbi:hypothetical protein AB4430_01675 [Vibrio kanaloae]|uniref:hypothetical protein n=1 Tax=Vibrio kanaloae TaxID=170673 RepID=UPI0014837755